MSRETLVKERRLDEKGRCCGRKPLHYKGGGWCSPPEAPMLFCFRCDRAYDVNTGRQKENWAFKKKGKLWLQQYPLV
ncbi:MAG: hypothetical protein GY941_21540 [Planctomycetes bacterium]|nr:hypothetical protein [Planctomycetota bacterium]